MPPYVSPQAIHDLVVNIGKDPDREAVKAEIRAADIPIYSGDPDDPDAVIQIAADGRRTRGRFVGGTFVSAGRAGKHPRERSVVRVAARRRR